MCIDLPPTDSKLLVYPTLLVESLLKHLVGICSDPVWSSWIVCDLGCSNNIFDVSSNLLNLPVLKF